MRPPNDERLCICDDDESFRLNFLLNEEEEGGGGLWTKDFVSQMQSYFFITSLVSFDVGSILDIFSNESQLSFSLFMVEVNGVVVVCSPRFNFVCLPEPSTANDDVFSFIGSMSALR